MKEPDSANSSGSRPDGFGALWVTVFLDFLGFGIVIPLLPLYASELGVGATGVGAIIASYAAAQFVMAPILGGVGDRHGRKRVLVAALVGSSAGSLITGLAGSFGLLLLGRVVDGASGASLATAQAMVADVAPEKDRPRLYGLLGAAIGLGFVAGPALGGLLGLVDRRLPFFVAATVAALNAVAAARRLPDTPARVGPAIGPGERLRQRWVAASRAGRWIAVSGFTVAAFGGFEATFPLLAADRLGVGLAGLGLIFAAVGVLLAVVQGLLVGPIIERRGESGTVRLGLCCLAVGLVATASADTWASVGLGLVVLVVGQAMVTPALTSLVARAAGDIDRGAVLGAQQSVGAVARTVGPLLAGAMWSQIAPAAPYLFGAVVLVAVWAILAAPESAAVDA